MAVGSSSSQSSATCRVVGIPRVRKKPFFGKTVLAHLEYLWRRHDRTRSGHFAQEGSGYVFKLVSHDVHVLRKIKHGSTILEGRHDQAAEISGGRTGRRIDETEIHPERQTGPGQHPAQLPATNHADPHLNRPRGSVASGSPPFGDASSRANGSVHRVR